MENFIKLTEVTKARKNLESTTQALDKALEEGDLDGALDCADRIDMLILMLKKAWKDEDLDMAATSAINKARVAQAKAELMEYEE